MTDIWDAEGGAVEPTSKGQLFWEAAEQAFDHIFTYKNQRITWEEMPANYKKAYELAARLYESWQ